MRAFNKNIVCDFTIKHIKNSKELVFCSPEELIYTLARRSFYSVTPPPLPVIKQEYFDQDLEEKFEEITIKA